MGTTRGGIHVNDELHEAIISLTERFHALKTEMALGYPDWQVAIRERDFDRMRVSLPTSGT
jgi:hypothetical protein